MDVLDLLKADHERARALFANFNRSTEERQKRRIFESLRHELQVHFYVEESVFYPAFLNYPEFSDQLKHAYAEHNLAKDCLQKLVNNPNLDAAFHEEFEHLREEVLEHMEEEEGEFFSHVRKVMRRPEREKLGRLVQATKSERQQAA